MAGLYLVGVDHLHRKQIKKEAHATRMVLFNSGTIA